MEVSRVPTAHANAYLVRFDWQKNWWGSWRVVGLEDHFRVGWVAAIDEEHSIQPLQGSPIEVTEQSIHSLRSLCLHGLPNPFVEVIGATHMGHGNLYLYELDLARRELRLKLRTFVMDRHADGSLIAEGGVLRRAYRDVDGDGHADVEILGAATLRSETDDSLEAGVQQVDLRRVFLWSGEAECFREDRSARRGVDQVYPGRT